MLYSLQHAHECSACTTCGSFLFVSSCLCDTKQIPTQPRCPRAVRVHCQALGRREQRHLLGDQSIGWPVQGPATLHAVSKGGRCGLRAPSAQKGAPCGVQASGLTAVAVALSATQVRRDGGRLQKQRGVPAKQHPVVCHSRGRRPPDHGQGCKPLCRCNPGEPTHSPAAQWWYLVRWADGWVSCARAVASHYAGFSCLPLFLMVLPLPCISC